MRPTTILLVEDNKLVLRMVKETLELEGWQVETCENGGTALQMIQSSEHYDLMILDNDLPIMTGLELIQKARRLSHRCHTPIIMLSAGLYRAEARQTGADAFLEKPNDIHAIVETIKDLLTVPTEAGGNLHERTSHRS